VTASEREIRLLAMLSHGIAVLSPPLRHQQYGKCAHRVTRCTWCAASIRQGSWSYSRRETIMNRMNTTIAALVCASLVAPMLPLSQAVAAPVGKTSISKSADGVTLVGRRGWGPGALFGGIIAGALIATAISEGRADDRDMRRCDRDFRGFDPRSGTYIDRYGDERICPYLR
jgi:hypothetical protein